MWFALKFRTLMRNTFLKVAIYGGVDGGVIWNFSILHVYKYYKHFFIYLSIYNQNV